MDGPIVRVFFRQTEANWYLKIKLKGKIKRMEHFKQIIQNVCFFQSRFNILSKYLPCHLLIKGNNIVIIFNTDFIFIIEKLANERVEACDIYVNYL